MGCSSSKATAHARKAGAAPTAAPQTAAEARAGEHRGFRSQLIQHSNQSWHTFYTKDKELGQGMTGKVFRVIHKRTGERFALKCMDANKIDAELLEDLVNEIELLQTLDHPNIIKLHEFFYDGATVRESSNIYLVMELCEGGELFDRLHAQRGSHYSEAKAAQIVSMMLSAVAYVHSRGVTHRDLKLENFLFESTEEHANLKLIDFGLSSKYASAGMTRRMHTMVGTPYYIAPEILENSSRGYTNAVDMWSLGVITYMLLSGTPPFRGRHDAEVLQSVKRGRYTLSGRRWEHVSEEAKNFIRQLLLYAPERRYAAMAALKDPWMIRAREWRAQALAAGENKPSPGSSTRLDDEIVDSLRAFTRFSHLKRAALEAIAFQMSAPKLAKLREAFLEIDTDATGYIRLDELRKALSEKGGISVPEADIIFREMDQDKKDMISYSEFLAATLSKRFYMREERIRAAFEKLDRDGTGYISRDNLRDMLGDDFTPERVDAMMGEADANGDGQIDYEEFLALFREEAAVAISPEAAGSQRASPGHRSRYGMAMSMGLGGVLAAPVQEGGSVVLEGGPSEVMRSRASSKTGQVRPAAPADPEPTEEFFNAAGAAADADAYELARADDSAESAEAASSPGAAATAAPADAGKKEKTGGKRRKKRGH